ncbi:MAG: hypothetical protein IPI93_11265 [Sphingobacteriaceae bacterium]|nr:hypothetical protein [Sphingobacteriaceae bacterium]
MYKLLELPAEYHYSAFFNAKYELKKHFSRLNEDVLSELMTQAGILNQDLSVKDNHNKDGSQFVWASEYVSKTPDTPFDEVLLCNYAGFIKLFHMLEDTGLL